MCHDSGTLVMTSKVAFHKRYLERKFYYKYMVYSPDVNPEELLFIGQANSEVCKNCFRVRTLPSSKHSLLVTLPLNTNTLL